MYPSDQGGIELFLYLNPGLDWSAHSDSFEVVAGAGKYQTEHGTLSLGT